MSEFGITFQAGMYRLGEYRYDHLADAIEYARLKRAKVSCRACRGRLHPQSARWLVWLLYLMKSGLFGTSHRATDERRAGRQPKNF